MSEGGTILAVGGGPDHYGLLPSASVDRWRELSSLFTKEWKELSNRRRIDSMTGCLDKLSNALLQARRMQAHHDFLLNVAASGPQNNLESIFQAINASNPALLSQDEVSELRRSVETSQLVSAAIRGGRVIADFEGLLLQGRAVLDRLTWLISGEYKSQCNSFRRLRRVVAGRPKIKTSRELLTVLDEAMPWFGGVFGRIEGGESLRDLVSHKHSITEGSETCFTVTFLPGTRAILFDCETLLPQQTEATALFAASQEAARYLSFVVLNCLSVLVGIPTLPLTDYDPTWQNLAVAYSDFVLDEPDDSPLGPYAMPIARRMTPDGSEMKLRNMNPAILTHVLKFGS